MSNNISWLADRINGVGAPVVIDGGMGTLLEKSGVPMDGSVWSGRAVLTHPDAVRQAHEDYITAGAEVVITNTFSTGRHMLEPGGLGDQVKQVNLAAVSLAQQAIDNVARGPVAIAGSICEWVHSDDPQWHTPEAVGRSAREQAELLAEAGVDLIALEMCEQTPFSVAVVEAALETGLHIWIGVSAKTHEHSTSLSVCTYKELDFESMVKSVAGYPAMMMNIMHTPVTDMDEAIEIVKRYWHGPVGIYPDSGYFAMPNWQFVDIIDPHELVENAQSWIDNGARMVGGCCGLGPEHIAALRQTISGE